MSGKGSDRHCFVGSKLLADTAVDIVADAVTVATACGTVIVQILEWEDHEVHDAYDRQGAYMALNHETVVAHDPVANEGEPDTW